MPSDGLEWEAREPLPRPSPPGPAASFECWWVECDVGRRLGHSLEVEGPPGSAQSCPLGALWPLCWPLPGSQEPAGLGLLGRSPWSRPR